MDRHYVRQDSAALRLFTLKEDASGEVLRGKALYNGHEKEMTFVENMPRGPRSKEIGRTAHSRMVRRPDGMYTVTFRVDAGTKYLRQQMIVEVSDLVKMIEADRKGGGR